MVIDDDADSREVLRQMVESLGARVILSHDGRDALTRLATTSPDLIFFLPTLEHERPRAITWRPPTYRMVLSIVRSPFYAGAYAFGRRETRTRVVEIEGVGGLLRILTSQLARFGTSAGSPDHPAGALGPGGLPALKRGARGASPTATISKIAASIPRGTRASSRLKTVRGIAVRDTPGGGNMRSHRDHLLGTCRQVVGSALGATLIGLSLLAGSATAAAILEPGDRVSLASADSCTQTIGDLSLLPPLDRELPASPPAPPGLVSASAACDQVARRLKAEVVTPAGVSLPGRFAAYTTLRYDFQVAASTGTTGDTVGAWVSFDVAWKGVVWATELTSNPAVELTLTLRDLTDAKIVKKATILSRDAKTIRFALPNVTDSGDALDSARVRDVLSAVLTRSHSYRVELQLVCEVFQDATAPVASSTCDFKDAFPDGLDGAVTLDELSIKVGIDERDLLSQVAQLREDLATHTHIFLTGRGVGHNNTEAVTSPAILPAATNAASLRISPPSGVYGTTQQFDLQLVVTASGRTIVGARATLDGEDVTVPLGGCVIPGRLLPAGQTFRCPGLTGDLLSPGTHIFTVTLDFNDGTSVTRGVNWRVLTNTEP